MTYLQELAKSVSTACCDLLQIMAGNADFTASFQAQLVWHEFQKLLFRQFMWQDCQRLLVQDDVCGVQESRKLAGLVW